MLRDFRDYMNRFMEAGLVVVDQRTGLCVQDKEANPLHWQMVCQAMKCSRAQIVQHLNNDVLMKKRNSRARCWAVNINFVGVLLGVLIAFNLIKWFKGESTHHITPP